MNNLIVVENSQSIEEPPVDKQPEPIVQNMFSMFGFRKRRTSMF